METDMRNNFQELRNMWSSKSQGQEKPIRSTSISSQIQPEKQQQQQQQQKLSAKPSIPILKVTNDTTTITSTKKDSSNTPTNERRTIFESVEKLPSIEENIPPPPPSIIFQNQIQTVATLNHTLHKMTPEQKKTTILSKTSGIHRWHVTRHVFRSGLIFNRIRRASDSILPLLMKTHRANNDEHHPRTESIDSSTFNQTPFESLIDYLTYDKNNDKDSLTIPAKIKRSASYTGDCIRRNKLDDSIFQYEMILRHLKNYEQFMTTYPMPSTNTSLASKKQREQSLDSEPINSLNETEEKFLTRTAIPNRQTQSLSRNVGRTFADFIMNDLFLSPTPKSSSSNLQRGLSISDASSQTDISEPLIHETKDSNETTLPPPIELGQTTSSISNEEAKAVLNELDNILDIDNQEIPKPSEDSASITPNSEINVIVINSSTVSIEVPTLPVEKPLMQRIFEGSKTAYTPADLDMKTVRIPEEMMLTYETAKKRCFFDSEEVVYATKMIKISRRGYTQHVRMLCITTERVYNITKKHPYPKEGVLFRDILGITCTPYKDGFMCIHTREAFDDRGDWLVVVDHPCEFITQLFMAMRRNDNDDEFVRFETKFLHCRRCFGEVGSSSDCTIEARLSDTFRIKKEEYDYVIIFTP